MPETPPGVTRLDETQPCSGYRWSHMPFKALRDAELYDTYKCKKRGRWEYGGKVWCWQHLHVQLRPHTGFG